MAEIIYKGLCCRCFILPVSPEELIENYEHYVLNKQEKLDHFHRGMIIDIDSIIENFKYIGYHHINFCSLMNPRHKLNSKSDFYHLYTCSQLSPEGECLIYDTRPQTCEAYVSCEYDICESTYCEFNCLYEKGK